MGHFFIIPREMSDQMAQYEIERQKRVAENERALRKLGIVAAVRPAVRVNRKRGGAGERAKRLKVNGKYCRV